MMNLGKLLVRWALCGLGGGSTKWMYWKSDIETR